MSPKEIVINALTALFIQFDQHAASELLHPDYIQHNPAVPTGAAPIIGFLPALKESGLQPVTHRVIAEGNFVVVHSTYEQAHAFGAETLVGFDVFRVEDNKLAEHWDNLQPLVAANPSGHTMTDGATTITNLNKTAENKALVEAFVVDVLQGAAPDNIVRYISTDHYIQHNPNIEDGLEGLGEAMEQMAKAGVTLRYTRTPIVVAEGNFVFTASEGQLGNTPTAFFDLFRVENGKIVEHWDTVSAIPAEMAHSNGKF